MGEGRGPKPHQKCSFKGNALLDLLLDPGAHSTHPKYTWDSLTLYQLQEEESIEF